MQDGGGGGRREVSLWRALRYHLGGRRGVVNTERQIYTRVTEFKSDRFNTVTIRASQKEQNDKISTLYSICMGSCECRNSAPIQMNTHGKGDDPYTVMHTTVSTLFLYNCPVDIQCTLMWLYIVPYSGYLSLILRLWSFFDFAYRIF